MSSLHCRHSSLLCSCSVLLYVSFQSDFCLGILLHILVLPRFIFLFFLFLFLHSYSFNCSFIFLLFLSLILPISLLTFLLFLLLVLRIPLSPFLFFQFFCHILVLPIHHSSYSTLPILLHSCSSYSSFHLSYSSFSFLYIIALAILLFLFMLLLFLFFPAFSLPVAYYLIPASLISQ